MPWQLIYTSAPRTLTAGQPGYGTVARSVDLRDALIQRLERLSYYPHGASAGGHQPVICAHRLLDVRGARYHLLSRVQDAGLDFTHRTNHVAHHLVFEARELAGLPSPAAILLKWNGWRAAWHEEPRLLDGTDWANLSQLPRVTALPARAWARATGDAGAAAALVTPPADAGCSLINNADAGPELLELFAESLELLDPDGTSPAARWQVPFTTYLQAEDQLGDFRWRGVAAGSIAVASARPGANALISELAALAVPSGELAQLARLGRRSPVSVAQAQPTPASPTTPSPAPQRLVPRRNEPSPSRPEPRVPPAPTTRPTVPERSSRTRLSVALAALVTLLALFSGLVWPGWLNPRPPPGPLASAPTAPNRSAPLASVISLKEDVPPPPAVRPVKPVPPGGELPVEVRERLRAVLDDLPTGLVLLSADRVPVALPPLPALAEMARQADLTENLTPTGPALSANGIEIRAVMQWPRLTLAEGTGALIHPQLDLVGKKSLRFKVPPRTERTEIEFEWVRLPGRPAMLHLRGEGPHGLSLVFRPATGTATFPMFRILAVEPERPPEPLRLPTALLRLGQTSLGATLDPALQRVFERWQPAPLLDRLQLRPVVNQTLDLYRAVLPPAATPARGAELDFGSVTSRVILLTKEAETDLGRLAEEIKAVDHTNRAVAADLTLGVRFGHPAGGGLDSLTNFVAGDPKRKADERGFESYLHELLKKHLPPGRLSRLKESLANPDQSELNTLLADAGVRPALVERYPDGFYPVWRTLRELSDRRKKLKEDHRNRTAQHQKLMLVRTVVPTSLAGVSHTGLWVLETNGVPLFELIRFEDQPPPKP